MIRKNIPESRGRNLTKINLNYPDRMVINVVENKARTHKKNTKSENNHLQFALKSSNHSSVNNNRDSKSRIDKNSDILRTVNYDELQSLQDIKKNINLHAKADKFGNSHALMKKIKLKKYNDL